MQKYHETLKPDSFENHVIEKAFGNPIALSAAPTTAGGELPRANDCGYFGTNLYINLGGVVVKLVGVAV